MSTHAPDRIDVAHAALIVYDACRRALTQPSIASVCASVRTRAYIFIEVSRL